MPLTPRANELELEITYPHEWTSEQRLTAYWYELRHREDFDAITITNTESWYEVLHRAQAEQKQRHRISAAIMARSAGKPDDEPEPDETEEAEEEAEEAEQEEQAEEDEPDEPAEPDEPDDQPPRRNLVNW